MIIVKTAKHIDWLSITIPNAANWRQFLPFPDLKRDGRGRHGYGQQWIDTRSGAVIETASTRDDMGTHITLSGAVLAAMRDDLGMIDDALVKRIEEYDGKCSRIDLAIDMFAARCTPATLNRDLLARVASIRARNWRFIDGHKNGINGATLDTGSPTSARRFRFYDKRAEQRIKDGEAWVRLEMQLRRLYARATVTACAEHGTTGTISASIGAYLKWSNIEYQSAIADMGQRIPTIPRKDSNRKRWLLGQVALALAKECLIDPEFRARFDLSVNAFLDNLK